MNTKIGQRLRSARKRLRLTQEHVGRIIGISRDAVIKIEQGSRKVSSEELLGFSKLYGIPVEIIINGEEISTDVLAFARLYNNLNENDRNEIKNLIQYKVNIQKSQVKGSV